MAPAYDGIMENGRYTALDREIVILAAVWDLIGSMVHYGYFEKEHRTDEAILAFKNQESHKLFIILLADFLSFPKDGTFGLTRPKVDGSLGQTHLGYLDKIVAEPHFSGDVSLLQSSVCDFAQWLDGTITVSNVWLPSIDRDGPLSVQRMSYLKICGTGTKHGFTRLGDIVGKLRVILSDNGTKIDEGQSYLVLPDFQQWFRDDVFIASATTISWFLNEIRWGIYYYLRPEFDRAYTPTAIVTGAQMYEYDIPKEIADTLIRSMYWDLMNDMRSPPYFPRFTVQKYLRQLY